MRVDNGAVCQSATCDPQGNCPTPLVCRTVDNTCRTRCTTTDDCPGAQTCAATVCVENSESASPDAAPGALDGAAVPDAGSAGDVPAPAADAPAQSRDTAAPIADGPLPADVRSGGSEGGVDTQSSVVDSGGGLPVCSGKPLAITYDCSATPDTPPWDTLFSTQLDPGTYWSVSDGELQMTTADNEGIWFGNHRTTDTPNWTPAPLDQGDTLSLRARLGPNSEEWYTYLVDGANRGPMITFMKGFVYLSTEAGDIRHDVDTSVYHSYAMTTEAGWMAYSIDGVEVLRASSKALGTAGRGQILVGDGQATPGPYGNETGTFFVQEVVIKTYTACLP